jgi:hypothetical protein
MSSLYIEVRVRNSARIEDVVRDAISLANRMQVSVLFEFSSVKAYAHPGGDSEALTDMIWEKLNTLFESDPTA